MNMGIGSYGIQEGGCVRIPLFTLGISAYEKGNFVEAERKFVKFLHDKTCQFSWHKKAQAAEYLAKIYEIQDNNFAKEKYLKLVDQYHVQECIVKHISKDQCLELYGVAPEPEL